MAYVIVWLRSAVKQLKRIDRTSATRIIGAVSLLTTDRADSLDVKRIKGFDFYRIRVGAYRVVYQIRPDQKEYVICKVAHCKDVYQSLADVPQS